MLSPDLGGGCRLRRRPGSFFTVFLLFLFLFSSSLPPSILGEAVLGDSNSSSRARSVAPLVLTASSTANALSRSLLAIYGGIFRPVDLVLQSYIGSCLAGPDFFRSEVLKSLIVYTNTRSGVFSNRALRFDFGFDRLCSVLCKSEKSASTVIPFLSPLVGCAKSSFLLNPTGVCNLSYSSSRQDKYNLPTPTVLNLYSKFTVDFGVLHGLKSVMDEVYYESSICNQRIAWRGDHSYHNCTSRRVRYKLYSPLVRNLDSKLFFGNFGLSPYGIDGLLAAMGVVFDSIDYVYWLKDLLMDRICYRLCTARIIGFDAMNKHTDTTSFGLIPALPETYRIYSPPSKVILTNLFYSDGGMEQEGTRKPNASVGPLFCLNFFQIGGP